MQNSKVIPFAPNYIVRNDGTVWKGGKQMALRLSNAGYLRVTLTIKPNLRRSYSVHRLVCHCFHGRPPSRLHRYVRHINGNSLDNRPCNVIWGTHAENMMDRDLHGRTAKGERNGTSRLTESIVLKIRRLAARGASTKRLAELFGIAQPAASHIVTGRSWRSVGGPRTVRRSDHRNARGVNQERLARSAMDRWEGSR